MNLIINCYVEVWDLKSIMHFIIVANVSINCVKFSNIEIYIFNLKQQTNNTENVEIFYLFTCKPCDH